MRRAIVVDPWLGAPLVVFPLAVLFALRSVPGSVTVGAFAYVGVLQVAQAAIGYGRCESVGIPTHGIEGGWGFEGS